MQRWVATREGFKPREVEEPVDYYWHRPLAGLFVQAIEHTSITPNQLTFASGGASVLSGAALGLAAWINPWWAVVGALFLLLSIVFDCADGQLARIRKISSPLGRALDGCMDAMAPLFVFHGMAFFLVSRGWGYELVWPVGAVAGASLLWHASVYDVSKNIWLHATHPDFSLGGNTLLSPKEMEGWKGELEEKGERFSALVMSVWVTWTKPQLKTLEPWLDESHTPRNDEERAIFRQQFAPAMHMLTWLGFGTHLFLMTMSAIITPIEPRAFLAVWALMAVPMNIMCLWVVATRGRRERAFVNGLVELRSADQTAS